MNAPTTCKGAIHIHTTYSDGSGTMAEIVAAARAAGLDFIVITDHNTLAPREQGWEGWHDGLLVVVGAEITPDTGGHVVALGVDSVDDYQYLSEGEYLYRIAQQGGAAFLAHPEGKRKAQFNLNLQRWQHWNTTLFAGMEIWSFMHDWIKDLKIIKLGRFHRDPLNQVAGPDPWVLAAWDALTEKRPVAGIASLDAHARRLLLKRWTFFPYEFMFRTTLTYVRTPVLTGDGDRDAKTIIHALARGRAYVNYEILGDARDFRFEGRAGDQPVAMGQTLTAPEAPVDLAVHTPVQSEIKLLRAGKPVAQADGRELRFAATEPGAYRVEVSRSGRPWIFSNPIYIREAAVR